MNDNKNNMLKLYVSPQGNDAWSGRLPEPNVNKTDGPLATFQGARDAARQGGPDKPKRIIVRAGNYFLPEPLLLGADDSQLTIEAMAHEKVVMYGGRRIQGWQKDDDRFWMAKISDVAGQKWDFRMLVVNGHFCPRARYPRTGTFQHCTKLQYAWREKSEGPWYWDPTPTDEAMTTIQYKPGDLGAWLSVPSAEMTFYHAWDESCVKVAAHDEINHVIRLASPLGHPPGAYNVNEYVVWNIREGMTTPGQWYLDRDRNAVVYWPLPGEEMTSLEAIAPAMESIVRIAGEEKRPAQRIHLQGFTLSVTNAPFWVGGFGAGKYPGAVSLEYANDCRLSGLSIDNVAGYGISALHCNSMQIEGCEIKHTGAGGIRFQGDDSIITRNRIGHVGLMFPSGIAVWNSGKNGVISHNRIWDATYTGIADSQGPSRIENNDISAVMQVLHDGGGVYVSGGKGTVIRGNCVHDIDLNGRFAHQLAVDPEIILSNHNEHAYYLDERCEQCLVEGNLAIRAYCMINNHMAHRNTMRNNVFISDGDARFGFTRATGYTFEKNVIYAKGAIMVTNPQEAAGFSRNIFFSSAGKYQMAFYKPDTYSRERITPGIPDGNVAADPLFVDWQHGNYRYKPDSPAWKLGIQAITVSMAEREYDGKT